MNKNIKKQYAISILKGAIGGVPYAGTFMNEVIFEARARLKQERIFSFIEKFADYVNSKNSDKINLEDIEKDDFGDIFEDIIISVSRTSADHKIIIFKNILWSKFEKPESDTELILRYISITNSLSELQFFILSKYSIISDRVLRYETDVLELSKILSESQFNLQKESQLAKQGYSNSVSLLETRIEQIKRKIKKRNKALRDFENPNSAKSHGLSHSEFLPEVHDLISKGLLYDLALSSNMIGINENFNLTGLGRNYIDFVKEE